MEKSIFFVESSSMVSFPSEFHSPSHGALLRDFSSSMVIFPWISVHPMVQPQLSHFLFEVSIWTIRHWSTSEPRWAVCACGSWNSHIARAPRSLGWTWLAPRWLASVLSPNSEVCFFKKNRWTAGKTWMIIRLLKLNMLKNPTIKSSMNCKHGNHLPWTCKHVHGFGKIAQVLHSVTLCYYSPLPLSINLRYDSAMIQPWNLQDHPI